MCQDVNANTTIFDYVTNAYLLGIASNTTESSTIATSGPSNTASSTVANTTAAAGSPFTSCSTAIATISGLVSTAVPIGIGVGLGGALALLSCALGALLFRERRRRIHAENFPAGTNGYSPVPENEKPHSPVELAPTTAFRELDSWPVHGPSNLPMPPGDQCM